MTFIIGSIAMTAFALVWALYHGLVKQDLHEHMEAVRIGAFFLGVWGLVWWWLLS